MKPSPKRDGAVALVYGAPGSTTRELLPHGRQSERTRLDCNLRAAERLGLVRRVRNLGTRWYPAETAGS